MAGSVAANHKFHNDVVELALSSGLNSPDVVRVLTAILVQIMMNTPAGRRDVLWARMNNWLIDHTESFKQGQAPVLYSPYDVMPGPSEMH